MECRGKKAPKECPMSNNTVETKRDRSLAPMISQQWRPATKRGSRLAGERKRAADYSTTGDGPTTITRNGREWTSAPHAAGEGGRPRYTHWNNRGSRSTCDPLRPRAPDPALHALRLTLNQLERSLPTIIRRFVFEGSAPSANPEISGCNRFRPHRPLPPPAVSELFL
ncbi:hypothetical protein EVAR_94519_1 [Eumeta japonica]|uniref:Uncharacterized protein n=1 Tax=Eumeta variegata TaxID=151549 RepID=A0A4C1UUQ4_EUMVA|nr:hypothetical protein EVAR_94519_1 [Eumeta japonica]